MPSILARGLLIRKLVIQSRKVEKTSKNKHKNENPEEEANEETKDSVNGNTDDLHGIYSDKLYGDDSCYTYYFSVNLLCSCSSNQMSDGFAKAIL